ncbi:MAG TPA: DUF2442 domain-containing protein [Thermoanaerobaculia bacterium]|nr:DUF2442 domain-containing protein [Thermoanaerobaculia bacterium]
MGTDLRRQGTEGDLSAGVGLFDVIEVRHVRDYVLWIKFEDGSEGEVDRKTSLRGPVFEPLRNVDYFKKVRMDADLGTITWPNGADIAPETLYQRIHAARRSR